MLCNSAEHLVLHAQLRNLAAFEQLVCIIHLEAGVLANVFVFEYFAEDVEVFIRIQHEVVSFSACNLVNFVGVQQFLVEINPFWCVVQSVTRLKEVVLVIAHDHSVCTATKLLNENGVLMQSVLRECLSEFKFFWSRF